MNNNVIITEALQRLNKMSRMSDSKSLKESKGRKRRLKESADTLWYGIPGIKFIYLNNWADPLIEYKGKKIDSYIVEDTMWERFLEDGGQDQDFDAFGDYMRDNAYDVYELCELAINPDYYDESYNRKLKESIRRVLRRLNEGQMSYEDRVDSELLRSIYNKSLKRKNAKLTPEEQEVMAKYGLKRSYDGTPVKPLDPNNPYEGSAPIVKDRERARLSRWDSGRGDITNDKINLADRARKIPQRGRGYENSLSYGYALDDDHREFDRDGIKFRLKGKGLLDKERNSQNTDMSKPYRDMSSLLRNRSYNAEKLAGIDAEYDKKWAELQAEMDRLDRDQKYDRQYHAQGVADAQAGIDAMLRRPKKEESYRRKSARRFKR